MTENKSGFPPLHLPRLQRGYNIFQGGGVQFLPGGGVRILISIETHITCDFPGGPDPLSPSGFAHEKSRHFWGKRFNANPNS